MFIVAGPGDIFRRGAGQKGFILGLKGVDQLDQPAHRLGVGVNFGVLAALIRPGEADIGEDRGSFSLKGVERPRPRHRAQKGQLFGVDLRLLVAGRLTRLVVDDRDAAVGQVVDVIYPVGAAGQGELPQKGFDGRNPVQLCPDGTTVFAALILLRNNPRRDARKAGAPDVGQRGRGRNIGDHLV